jgi:serine/threonine-protein kinase
VKRATWISSSLLVAALAASPHAFAQNDKAAAEALFDDAKRLMDAKRYPEACKKFADSQKLDPGVGTLLNLGRCYKENGQTASAWSTYREAASQARAESQADREALAREEALALEPRLTKLVIEVNADTAAIAGLEIKRDGAAVPQGLWGVPAPVDPGVRSIDVTAPGKKPLHLDARTEGAGATARIVIPPLEDGPPPAAVPVAAATTAGAPADQGTPPSDPGKTQRIIGYVVGGTGIVAIGVGTWFVLYAHAQDQVGDKNADDPARQEQYYGDAKTSRTVGFISIGSGAALLAGGIVLVVTAPHAATKASFTVVPEVAADRAGLHVLGRF